MAIECQNVTSSVLAQCLISARPYFHGNNIGVYVDFQTIGLVKTVFQAEALALSMQHVTNQFKNNKSFKLYAFFL